MGREHSHEERCLTYRDPAEAVDERHRNTRMSGGQFVEDAFQMPPRHGFVGLVVKTRELPILLGLADDALDVDARPDLPRREHAPFAEIGACVEFQGIVRETEQDRKLAGLHYEAHEPMARRHLERIFDELAAAHPCVAVTFIHRLGWVPVGEASLFVRVLAAHRGEALRFLAEAVDRMKADVPIWKAISSPH